MANPSVFKKLTAFGLLLVWLALLGIPLAEALDADHKSPDSSDHAIEKVFRISGLTPNVQVEQEKITAVAFPIHLPEMPIHISFLVGPKRRDMRLALGGPPGPPGIGLFKVFSNFRI